MGESSQSPCYPPTLSVGKDCLQESDSNVRAHGSVKYQIDVHLHRSDRIICSRQADIHVVNSVNQLPPPIPLDDFPNEYRCAATKLLSVGKIKAWFFPRNIAPKPRPQLTIEFLEPRVICLDFSPQCNRLETVDLMATFRIRTRSSTDLPPDDLHVTMRWLLKTTTFVAVIPMQEMPTSSETTSNAFVARTSESTPERNAKMLIRDWQISTSCHNLSEVAVDAEQPADQVSMWTHRTNVDAPQWSNKQHLHLAVAGKWDCPTTFFTPYISRRHTLQLRLDCHAMGNSITQFKFDLPVQIVLLNALSNSSEQDEAPTHGSAASSDGVSFEAQQESAESPPYVP